MAAAAENSPAPEASANNSPPEEDPAIRKAMIEKHGLLANLYNEWHGFDLFQDSYDGVIGREKRFGAKWRKGLVSPQHFSRTQRVIAGIREYAAHNKMQPFEAVLVLQKEFEDCKNSVSNFVVVLQKLGYVPIRAPQAKKKATEEA